MGATNTDHYTEHQKQMAMLAKALAHPARIAIIEFLLRVEDCICNDIVHQLPLSQPTVSQHLKELKNAGVIKGNIEGNAICYCIDETSIETIKHYFNTFSNCLQHRNCCPPNP
jgi:ArsR family transcriptional regulator, arsenate/arsenite/antimonite-responsive transcriptional repressor